MSKDQLGNSRETISGHLLIWVSFWATDFLFTYGYQHGKTEVLPFIFNAGSNTVYFYICVFWVILPTISKSKTLTFAFIAILLLFFVFSKMGLERFLKTDNYVNIVEKKGTVIPYISFEFWRYSYMTFFSFAYWYYVKSIHEEKLRRTTEEKLFKTEIAFLKAQINPHFLFNTLNFVYRNVAHINERSGEAILSLTRLLRYSVESTKSEQTTVEKELQAVEEYINLQRLRFGDRLAVLYQREGNVFLFSFPPLVLISLVENAFKYGIQDDDSDPITIQVHVDSHCMRFRCINKKRLDFIDRETTVVGYTNIQRRLEMAYGGRFTLKTLETDSHFEVSLHIIWTL